MTSVLGVIESDSLGYGPSLGAYFGYLCGLGYSFAKKGIREFKD